MSKKQNYINNKEFLKSILTHKKAYRLAKKMNKPLPPIPDYIGECFLKIAHGLAYKPNFINYTYREDMMGDGIENCLRYYLNFNPAKSKNPFAYFTQIMWYAFLRRIQAESKQLYIKYKSIQNSDAFDESARQSQDDGAYDNTYLRFLQKHMGQVITNFEAKKPKKILRNKKPQGVECFFNWGTDCDIADDTDINDDVELTLQYPCA